MLDSTELREATSSGVIGGKEEPVVDGRKLHAYLAVGKNFRDWVKDRIRDYGFIEGFDFERVTPKSGRLGSRRRIDYSLSITMAQELCMVERTAKGKEARLYFIEMERRLRGVLELIETDSPDLLKTANELAFRIAQRDMEIDELTASVGCYPLGSAALILGTDRKRLRRWLVGLGVLMGPDGRLPRAKYERLGYLRAVRSCRTDELTGRVTTFWKLFITSAGLEWLTEKWAQRSR